MKQALKKASELLLTASVNYQSPSAKELADGLKILSQELSDRYLSLLEEEQKNNA